MIFSFYDILMSIRFALWILCIEYTGENPSHLIIVCSRGESSLLQPTWQYNLPSQYQKCYIIFLYRIIHSARTECAIAVFHRHTTLPMLSFKKISWESLARFRNAREREKERERERGEKTFRIFFFMYSLVFLCVVSSHTVVKYSSKEIIISCSRFSFSFILWALKSSTYSVWR